MNELVKTLVREFSADEDYAHDYMTENANMRIAAQIRALRIQRNWSQEDLAERSGMAQARISKIESADFNSLTLKTLRALSRAFDVHLMATFVPFSAAILDFAALSPKWLQCTSRLEDLAFFEVSMSGNILGNSTLKISLSRGNTDDSDIAIMGDAVIGVAPFDPPEWQVCNLASNSAWDTNEPMHFDDYVFPDMHISNELINDGY